MAIEKIWKGIAALYKQHQWYMAKQLEGTGIGFGQYHFILAVCESPGIAQERLTEGIGVNKSTVTRALAQLKENGFLTREVHPADKRAYRLYPTGKALRAREVILRHCHEHAEKRMEGFTAEERELFAALLRRMSENVAHSAG